MNAEDFISTPSLAAPNRGRGGSLSPPTVRPPWPDELPRLADVFRDYPCQRASRPLVLLTSSGGVERIAAIAGRFEPVNGIAGLTLHARPRFLAMTDIGLTALLEGIIAAALEAGVTKLITTDDLRTGDPRVSALQRNGFTISIRFELWAMELAQIQEGLEPVQTRLENAGRANRFHAEPMRAEHLPAVRTLMETEHLLEGLEITLADIGEITGRGYEPTLSFIVFAGETLAGAILARRSGTEAVVVDAVAVDPAWRGDLVHHALFSACIRNSAALGARQFIYTVDTAGHVDTGRRVWMSGSRLLGEGVRLARPLG